MSSASDFRSIVVSLWFRLISLGIIGVVFAQAILLSRGKAQGWTFYLTTSAVVFEVVVRLISASLAGIVLATFCTAAIVPLLWYWKSSRELVTTRAIQVAVLLVVFLDSRLALLALIKSFASNHGPRFTTALLIAHFLVFAVALCIPRARREVVTSLDAFLGEKMTRRTAIATVAGAAALVLTEFALSKTVPTVRTSLATQRPKPNILLITFDALSAEDMSLYGYRLPTTPNIDAFASKATVFTNFYSGSTFTTPGLATVLTGTYPSENHVYQIPGQVRPEDAGNSLPNLMRGAGYATGALISSPVAYFLGKSLVNGFDVIPEPAFYKGGPQYLWDSTRPLHQDSGIGSRYDEHVDVGHAWYYPGQPPLGVSMRVRPDATFEQARQVLTKLPDGFFLWIHIVTPHDPYLPDAADRGRFIPDAELRSFEEESGEGWTPHYEPSQQSQVDRRRLGYDEFVATADRAFGAFMAGLENSGKLRDTTVIVSSDHGESFEGGVYQHRSAFQTRPVIHIPLAIRTPGQQESRRVAFTADQTALAPTILELAGQPRPDSMRGQSLAGWLDRDGQGEGEGLAFCQYLEQNSIFRPLRRGTVGVIDGQFQYVLDLATQKGSLRPLSEAQIWDLDRSTENPARAKALRAEIYTRFPELRQNPT
jgi:arylsulfatase A-like enzyme